MFFSAIGSLRAMWPNRPPYCQISTKPVRLEGTKICLQRTRFHQNGGETRTRKVGICLLPPSDMLVRRWTRLKPPKITQTCRECGTMLRSVMIHIWPRELKTSLPAVARHTHTSVSLSLLVFYLALTHNSKSLVLLGYFSASFIQRVADPPSKTCVKRNKNKEKWWGWD